MSKINMNALLTHSLLPIDVSPTEVVALCVGCGELYSLRHKELLEYVEGKYPEETELLQNIRKWAAKAATLDNKE